MRYRTRTFDTLFMLKRGLLLYFHDFYECTSQAQNKLAHNKRHKAMLARDRLSQAQSLDFRGQGAEQGQLQRPRGCVAWSAQPPGRHSEPQRRGRQFRAILEERGVRQAVSV